MRFPKWIKEDLTKVFKEARAKRLMRDCDNGFMVLEKLNEMNKILNELPEVRNSYLAHKEIMQKHRTTLISMQNRFNELSDELGKTNNYGLHFGKFEVLL